MLFVFLCGLGAFFFTQAFKMLFTKALQPWQKLLVVAVASGGLAANLFPHDWSLVVAFGFSGAGVAVVIHRLYRVLTVTGDWLIRDIMKNRRPR